MKKKSSSLCVFDGIAPSNELKRILRANGIESTSATDAHASLLVKLVEKEGDLKFVEKYHQENPETILVIVVDHENNDPLFQQGVLSVSKDGWSPKPNWEKYFWPALQQALLTRKYQTEILHWKTRCESLDKKISTLLTSSKKIVEKLESQVKIAGQIQRSVLPNQSPEVSGVVIASKFIAGTGRGGDYFNISELEEKKKFGILIANGKTHLAVAGLLSVLLKINSKETVRLMLSPEEFVQFLKKESVDRGDLGIWYGTLDRSKLKLTVASVEGGFEAWRWSDSREKLSNGSYQLSPGDFFTIYTHGLNKVLPKVLQRYESLIREVSDPLELRTEILSELEEALDGKSPPDDITMLHFQIQEKTLYIAA